MPGLHARFFTRPVLRRAVKLFIAMLAILGALAIGVWWYATRIANPCSNLRIQGQEPVTCYYEVFFFGPSARETLFILTALWLASLCMAMLTLSRKTQPTSR